MGNLDSRPPFTSTIECEGLAAVDEPLCPGASADAAFKFPPHYHPHIDPQIDPQIDPHTHPHIEPGSTIVTTNGAVST